MASEFPGNDPRNLWHTQPTEPFTMSTEEIRRTVQQRQQKARSEALLVIVLGLSLCLVFTWTFVRAGDLIQRLGWGVLTFWCAWFAWQTYRGMWPSPPAPDAAWGATLQSYRTELEKRRDYNRHVWRRLVLCFVGLALVLAPALVQALHAPRILLHAVPFFLLLAVWFALFFPMRKRKERELQQEIDELRAFENQARP